MAGLKETELCRKQGRTWSQALIDFLYSLLDLPGDGDELLIFGVIVVIMACLALIKRDI